MKLLGSWTLAGIGVALAAPIQAAVPPHEADVVETAGDTLILARSGANQMVIALDPGAILLGVDSIQALFPGDRIRYVPARRAAAIQYASELEVLPAVATDGERRIDVGALAAQLGTRLAPEGGRLVPVDVRSTDEFARGHLPGAISAPRTGGALAAVLPRAKDARLVFYGSSRQDRRPVEALREALSLGYRNAHVYLDGMRQWDTGRRPTEVQARDLARWLETEPAVVLDVRPHEEWEQGTFPRAIPVAAATMRSSDWIGKPGMPLLVFAGRDADDPVPAQVAEKIRGWQPSGDSLPLGGLKVLRGGFAAWKQARGKIVSARAATRGMQCVPMRREACPEEFLALWRADGGPRAPLLLDARIDGGAFRPAWAKHVSVVDLPSRLSELPRDRELVVFCARGRTSQVAQAILQKAGYKARYVRLPAPGAP
jgi:rhodanese-related sulfurtransferase